VTTRAASLSASFDDFFGSTAVDFTRGAQRVPVTWTRCHLGGARPWFECAGRADGRGCGRRVAKLYLGRGAVFACRRCHNLAYLSQSENARHRAISKSQKLRMRLGGGPSILDPFCGEATEDALADLLSVASQGDGGAGALARAGARIYGSPLSRALKPG
jgi:hypothetical protein